MGFGSLIGVVRLQVGDGASKDIPTDSEVAFTDMADLTKVRRGFSMLRLVGKCSWIHVHWNFMFSGRPLLERDESGRVRGRSLLRWSCAVARIRVEGLVGY